MHENVFGTKEDAIRFIESLPVNITQDEFQKYNEEVYKKLGLETVLTGLFAWELKSGYITKSKLEDNEKHVFHDDETNNDFRLQINLARSHYKPAPLTGANIPELYSSITIENVGIPGKENLRVFLFPLDGDKRMFFLQATPFPLFKNHFVLINLEKIPQKISRTTVKDLFDFVRQAPGYVACSNSDLEWTGASILKHMHYQVFDSLDLPVMNAPALSQLTWVLADNLKVEVLNYPFKGIFRISGDLSGVQNLMNRLIETWKAMDSKKNSVNLIVRKKSGIFEGYIFLRNQDHRTTEEFQRYKTEGVGIIEVAGECILPVPAGEEAAQILNEIRKDGLKVIKGIIGDNNPVKELSQMREIIGMSHIA